MFNLLKPYLTFKTFLWSIYIGVLAVITPHTQWMFSQFETADFPGLAWVMAIVTEAAIFGTTHMLVRHIEKRKPTTFNFEKSRLEDKRLGRFFSWWPMFKYRWLNVYALLLIIATLISGVANLSHAVEFGKPLKIVENWGIPYQVFTFAFGGILPMINLLFAAVIAKYEDSEQQIDPALEKAREGEKQAKAELRTIEQQLRQAEQHLRSAENALHESEQRYKALGDVVRYLFGKAEPLPERIRFARRTFPQLSQNGIAQILECSVSTVNGVLRDETANIQ